MDKDWVCLQSSCYQDREMEPLGLKTLRKDDLHFLKVLKHDVAVALDEGPLGAEGIFGKGVAEKAASPRVEICVAGGHYVVGFLAGGCLAFSL